MSGSAFVEDLLASSKVAEAVERVRVSGQPPGQVSRLLEEHAEWLQAERPAAAAAATFLAGVVARLETVQLWPGAEHLSPATNELLRRASAADGWIGTLRILREHPELLDHDTMISVVSWHAGLVGRAVPPTANGAALVITLGVVLSGRSQALAHLAWARACESTSVRRARFHMVRAGALAAACGDEEMERTAERALDSLHERFALPRRPSPVSTPSAGGVAAVSADEANASTLRDQGRYREAQHLLDQSIPVADEFGLTGNAMRMRLLRGLIRDDLSEYAGADQDFREAAELATKLGDGQRRFEALNNLAASFLKRDQPARAVAAFRAILGDADTSGVSSRRIAARNNLALAYARAGDHRMARDLYTQALELIGDDRSGSYWIAMPGLAGAHEELGERDALRDVGAVLRDHWFAERSERALGAYLASPTRNMEDPQEYRIADETWRAALGGYPMLMFTLTMALARADRAAGRDDLALHRLDAYLDTLGQERSGAAIGIGAELEAARTERDTDRREAGLQRLRAAVARSEQRLRSVTSAYDGDWILDGCRSLYEGLVDLLLADPDEAALAEALVVYEASRPMTLTGALRPGRPAEPTAGVTGGRVAVLADLERVLTDGPGVAVLVFVETATAVGAFLISAATGQRLAYVPLDVTGDMLSAAGDRINVAFNGDSSRFPPRMPLAVRNLEAVDLEPVDEVLARLGAVDELLPEADVICVVPSRSMEALPLHAIVTPDGRRLVQRAAVVVQASLSSFVTVATEPVRPGSTAKVFVAGVAAREDAHAEYFEADGQVFEHTGVATTTVTDTGATPSAILAGIRGHDVVHLACHGFVDMRDPLGSGLLLSDGAERPSRRPESVPVLRRRDFELTVRDIANEALTTNLLTLRACSTARRATVSAKEENATLTRALQLAGCRTVVSALWNVDQQSSLRLFEEFYAAFLAEGLPACQALARAQRQLLDAGSPYSHIYHWGPYMISGDWRKRS